MSNIEDKSAVDIEKLKLIKSIIHIANTDISESIKESSLANQAFIQRKIAAQRYLRTNDTEQMELMLDYVENYNKMIREYFNL